MPTFVANSAPSLQAMLGVIKTVGAWFLAIVMVLFGQWCLDVPVAENWPTQAWHMLGLVLIIQSVKVIGD